MKHEPVITINGKATTKAQAMTIRCALENFDHCLRKEGLGDDEHGIRMVENYCTRISEIRSLIFQKS